MIIDAVRDIDSGFCEKKSVGNKFMKELLGGLDEEMSNLFAYLMSKGEYY